MLVVTFKTEQQVNGCILHWGGHDGFQCLAGTADNVVFPGSLDGFGVGLDVVEVVAGNESSGELFTAVAQASVFIAYLLAVEINLPT